MRHGGRQCRVVIKNEHPYVLGIMRMSADAPGPVSQPQTPKSRRQKSGIRRALGREILQFGSEPSPKRFVRVQMIALGLAREEPIDGFEALGIECCEIRPRHGAVVRRDGVDRDIQRVMPARTEITILPSLHRDHQQHQQQNQNAQHLESAAPRYGIARRSGATVRPVAAGWRHSADSTLNSATSPSAAV